MLLYQIFTNAMVRVASKNSMKLYNLNLHRFNLKIILLCIIKMLYTILLYIWGLVMNESHSSNQKNNFLLFFTDEDTEYQECDYNFELGIYDAVICLDNIIPFLYTFYVSNINDKLSLQSVYKGGNLKDFIEIDKLLKIRFANNKIYLLYPKDVILDITLTKK